MKNNYLDDTTCMYKFKDIWVFNEHFALKEELDL